MKISRTASTRWEAEYDTKLRITSVTWDVETKSIRFEAPYVTDFYGTSHRNWKLDMTLDELAAMLKVVSDAIDKTDDETLARSFAQNLPALLRLATACSSHLLPAVQANQGPLK
jgi:hypothetical protein